MKHTKVYWIWQIFYPIGIYYVVSSLAYFVLELLMGSDNETYMLRQLVCSAVTIPFVMKFYSEDRRQREVVYGKRSFRLDAGEVRNILFSLISAATLGMAVNNIIAMTPLMEVSGGFETANEAFFGGQLIYELLGSCLLIPIAEELIFRGVGYRRLRVLLGVGPAVLCSALIFGIVHFNLVQFIYAAILGCLLAFLYEKTGFFYAPVLGHMAANTVAVLRQETGWLAFSYQPTAAGIGFTLLMLAAAFAVIGYMWKEYRKEKQS